MTARKRPRRRVPAKKRTLKPPARHRKPPSSHLDDEALSPEELLCVGLELKAISDAFVAPLGPVGRMRQRINQALLEHLRVESDDEPNPVDRLVLVDRRAASVPDSLRLIDEMGAELPESSTPAIELLASSSAESLGQQVRRLRLDCGWSIDVLADKVGVNRSTVIRHENNKLLPSDLNRRKYEAVFKEQLGRSIALTDSPAITANATKRD